MDVHRSRFVPFPASAITALAFSRSTDSNPGPGSLTALKLAIGRENGEIEIWNPLRGAWAQEVTFQGGEKTSIDDLQWIQEPDDTDAEGHVMLGQLRLFSIGSSPSVTEWNLSTGLPLRHSTGNFSEVWCFAAQPKWRPAKSSQSIDAPALKSEGEPRGQDLIVGCGDGALAVLTTADNDLQFKRFLARSSGRKARCMSVTYQNRDLVIAGFADGVIRVYDTRNGSIVRNMSLGSGLPDRPKSVLVWTVKCLPNGDIVSGDSNGEVRFWDGKSYSLRQRVVGHDHDCLNVVTSQDGRTVLSGSMEGKMAVYKLSGKDGERRKWAKTSQRRMHSGEIKAMTSFDSKGMSVVVSGGSDTTPIVTPLRDYGKEYYRALPGLPLQPPLASAPKQRLMVSWWDRNIYVWRIGRQPASDVVEEADKPRKLVSKVTIKGQDHVRSAAISADGKILAAATSNEVKLFQLRGRVGAEGVAVRKLDLPEDFETAGARLLAFSPNGKWLAATSPESEIYAVRLITGTNKPDHISVLPNVVELDRHHRKATQPTGLKQYDRTINRLIFSNDSSLIVASDLSGYLDSWVLEGREDLTAPPVDLAMEDSDAGSSDAASDSDSSSESSDNEEDKIAVFYGQHWADNPTRHLLPKLDSAALVLCFRPSQKSSTTHALVNGNPGIHATRHNPHAHSHELPQGQHRLWTMTARHQMYEFDMMKGRLTEWSRRNPTAVLPGDFKNIKDRVMGAIWDVTKQRERIWLYGSTWVYMLNTGADLQDDATSAPQPITKRKQKGSGRDGDEQTRKRRKGTSGAGDKVTSGERNGLPEMVTRTEGTKREEVDLDRPARLDTEDEGDETDDDDAELQLMQARSDGEGVQPAGSSGGEKMERKWWCTYKYRPILGMVPIGSSDSEDDADSPLEVVLVERPLWDVQTAKKT